MSDELSVRAVREFRQIYLQTNG